MSDHHIKKRKLILWMSVSLIGVLIVWGVSLQFTWPDDQEGEGFTWPEWQGSESESAQSFQTGLDNLMSKINPEETEEVVNEREIVTNPEQLSEEEIKQIEEDIFPKEKNAKEETN